MIKRETRTNKIESLDESLLHFVRCKDFGIYIFVIAVQLIVFIFVSHHQIGHGIQTLLSCINGSYVSILIFLCVVGAPLAKRRINLSQSSIQRVKQREEQTKISKTPPPVALNHKVADFTLKIDHKKKHPSQRRRTKNISTNQRNKSNNTVVSNTTPLKIFRNLNLKGNNHSRLSQD
mmetsp:Transcript_13008/g.20183  ORF Transcript_13008/g.20183 Transcript_13008/m.20183 type:complete len:177 (-) Transcript_13008:30-560(-)